MLWLGALSKSRTRLLFCRITQLGLLRLLTNGQVMGDSVLTIAEAVAVFDRWCEDPRVELLAEPRGMDAAFRQALKGSENKAATKVIMDAYLAGLAQAENATLVTFDKALCKVAKRHLLLSKTKH